MEKINNIVMCDPEYIESDVTANLKNVYAAVVYVVGLRSMPKGSIIVMVEPK